MSQLHAMPLLQGLTLQELMKIVEEKLSFDFHTLQADTVMVRQGERGDELHYIMAGELCSSYTLRNFCIEERINSGRLIEPTSLMGQKAIYRATYRCVSKVTYVVFSKKELFYLLTAYPVVRINLLNLFAREAQLAREQLQAYPGQTIEDHIYSWYRRMCLYPTGRKEVFIRIADFAEELNKGNRALSEALHGMEKKGMLHLKRNRTVIPLLEELPHPKFII